VISSSRTVPAIATAVVVPALVLTLMTAGCGLFHATSSRDKSAVDGADRDQSTVEHSGQGPKAAPAPWADPAGESAPALLARGSRPAALPAPMLIADKKNDRLVVVDPQGRLRWQFPRRGDLAPGQTFHIPDDAFFSPDGTKIVATEEDDFVVSVIDVASHRIEYRYGVPGHPGNGPNHVNNPDDAMLMPDGRLIVPDIKNCRILFVRPNAHRPSTVLGATAPPCRHDPPRRYGSPNGAFPMRNGNLLVTEINGSWLDEITPKGSVVWSAQLPEVGYPSDANEVGPDRYLVVDYSLPGQAVIVDHGGRIHWRYRPTGRDMLNQPSLALPLSNGDIAITDDLNHRVIIVDPRNNAIVWQYGHTGEASAAPGFLNNPDGLDLVPPHTFFDSLAPPPHR
jgi:hypothetical protein